MSGATRLKLYKENKPQMLVDRYWKEYSKSSGSKYIYNTKIINLPFIYIQLKFL